MSHALPAIEVIGEPDRALALLDGERLRLVKALAAEADSAAGLARRLGEKRQRVNYHLRLLEASGLLEAVGEHRRGSTKERKFRPVARWFVVDPSAAGELAACEPDETGDRFSATYLLAVAARAVREVARLMRRSKQENVRTATATIDTMVRLSTPRDYEMFVRDLTRAVAEVVARHHTGEGEGRWFRVITGAYPGADPSLAETSGDEG